MIKLDVPEFSLNYIAARQTMVESQVQPCGVTDSNVLQAFLEVPRELFVPKNRRFLAHSEISVETFDGRYLWRAADQARYLQALSLDKSDVVLLIGSGEGYTAALLHTLVETVIAIDEDEDYSDKASEKLLRLGYDRVACLYGPLTAGVPSEGPYDKIVLDGRVEYVPDELFKQLKTGGRLAAVVGSELNARAEIYTVAETHVARKVVFECLAPELKAFRKAAEFQF